MSQFLIHKIKSFFNLTPLNKAIILILVDGVSIFASLYFANVLILDLPTQSPQLTILGVSYAVSRYVFFILFQLYSMSWRFASTTEFFKVYKAVFWGGVSAGLVSLLTLNSLFSAITIFSFVVLETVFLLSAVLGARGFIRMLRDQLHFFVKKQAFQEATRILIIGAGDAGAMISKDILTNPSLNYQIIGFLDDDYKKQGQFINGIKVLGTSADLASIAPNYDVTNVVIAIPSATGDQIRAILSQHQDLNISFKITPSFNALLDGKVEVGQLREVKIEDLLGRNEVNDMIIDKSENYIKNKVCLVTGGGGSIGSELCRQILLFSPKALIVFENCEENMYQIERQLSSEYPDTSIHFCVGDVKDKQDLADVFTQYTPDCVFHAAAYKHVPLMEINVKSLIKNNVVGTFNVLKASKEYNIDRFILISTDKAVNPANVMGGSKRLCELMTLSFARGYGLNFSAVRFGNVLGSKGSVVPLFKEQIKRGGPITVTHPDITRYFMTIPEATRLVLQAGMLSTGGEIFTLDMGQPVKIVDLAKDMIKLYSPNDEFPIQIQFSGLRKGEKMYEELSYDPQAMGQTAHPKIFVDHESVKNSAFDLDQFLSASEATMLLSDKECHQFIFDCLRHDQENSSSDSVGSLSTPDSAASYNKD